MKQYKQLTLKERYQIEALLGMGLTARDIAAKLMRSNKTISSEMLRCTIGCYRAESEQVKMDRMAREIAAKNQHAASIGAGKTAQRVIDKNSSQRATNLASLSIMYLMACRLLLMPMMQC